MNEKRETKSQRLSEEELSGLCENLYSDIKRSRFAGKVIRFTSLGLLIGTVLALAVGIPLYYVIQKQETVDSLREENKTIVNNYSELVSQQKQTIEKFQTLYMEGIVRLEDKIERIERQSPHIFSDAKSIINKFKNAAGSAAEDEPSIQELLFLVSNHPDSIHEAIYQTLIDKCGIHHYEPKYLFFKHPLAHNNRTIVTSEFGLRTMIKKEFDKASLTPVKGGGYILPGYGSGWRIRYDGDKEYLIKIMYHSAYDLVNDVDSTVYARHDGRIIRDFENYGTYGRTIFYEYKHGDHVYREQLSHLESSPLKFKPNQKVKAGDILGYVGETGNTTGPHLHWTVWKPNPNQAGRWIAVDVYATKLLKDQNIVYIDKMWNR